MSALASFSGGSFSSVSSPINRRRLLWIDDEVAQGDPLLLYLRQQQFDIDVAGTGSAGWALIESTAYEAIILDLRLPDVYGLTVLKKVTELREAPPVLVVSGWYMEPESEALARRMGAADFLRKPVLDPDELVEAVRQTIASRKRPTTAEAASSSQISLRGDAAQLVGRSAAMCALRSWIDQIAATDLPVLVVGETGTGKDVVARMIHAHSRRTHQTLLDINCGAIPEGLIESELFGHCRGAFTGAFRDKQGLLEAADGGTVFLDEIGEMALPLQVRLLKFLDHGEVRRLGDARSRRVNVRVIAATNRPLQQEVAGGHFRRDLYFRLAAARSYIPPLRERLEDLDALVLHLLSELPRGIRRSGTISLSTEAMAMLRRHDWPGNVRELQHVLEYAVCLLADRATQLTSRELSIALPEQSAVASSAQKTALSAERQRVLAALEAHHWNRTETARDLGVNRKALWRILIRLGLATSSGQPTPE